MSKTVKKVSETVKKVTRVIMVGLIAMLGAKAEAHWYVAGGKPKRCTHCVEAELTDRDEKHDFEHTEEADFHLKTKRVELLCRSRTGVSTEVSTRPVHLVVQKRIVQTDATYEEIDSNRNPIGPARFDLVAKFSDLGLKEALDCSFQGLPPIEVLIRETSLIIDTYWCDLNVPRKCTPVSNFSKDSCTLANWFNFFNHPPIGTPYVCRQ